MMFVCVFPNYCCISNVISFISNPHVIRLTTYSDKSALTAKTIIYVVKASCLGDVLVLKCLAVAQVGRDEDARNKVKEPARFSRQCART